MTLLQPWHQHCCNIGRCSSANDFAFLLNFINNSFGWLHSWSWHTSNALYWDVGLQLCKPIYTVQGLILSSIVAFLSSVVAFWVAYSERNNRNILLATLCFGIAVVSVHFIAILNTSFVEVSDSSEFGPLISNEALAVIVVLTSFIILCLFLWVSATYVSTNFGC